jgi:hypothetical protein
VIRWLDENPVGMVLASVCGGLLLVALALSVIWALPAPAPSLSAEPDEGPDGLNLPVLAESAAIETYSVITERPVFNETRLPVLDLDLLAGSDEEVIFEEDIGAPDVELAGVIITPSIRMVTLRQKDSQESLVAFEGKPLEGNFGSWQVSLIEPRQVTLTSGSGEEMQLELQIHDIQIEEPEREESEAGQDNKEGEKLAAAEEEGSDEAGEPLSRAEEIRQRIAERREELRRAAEDENGERQPSYQEAIQAMMNQKRREEPQDDDEQKK